MWLRKIRVNKAESDNIYIYTVEKLFCDGKKMQFQLTVFLIMLVSFGNARKLALCCLNKHIMSLFFFCTESQCITQDQLKGSCINLKECPSLFNLLKKPNLTSDDRNYLRQSQCAYIGGSPWVNFSSWIVFNLWERSLNSQIWNQLFIFKRA